MYGGSSTPEFLTLMIHLYILRLISIIILFLHSLDLFSQNECFYLNSVFYDSDINYAALSRMDDCPVSTLNDNVFKVVNGKYTNYKLECLTSGLSTEGMNVDQLLEVILLKVENNQVIEAYYCPLSWRESPSSDVVLVSKRRFVLKKKFETSKLKFRYFSSKIELVILRNSMISLSEKD